MYMTSDRHTRLAQGLFDKMIELQRKKELNIKAYEIAYQDVIEKVCPDKCWWEITDCQIFTHLLTYKNPEKTVIEILRKLKED